MAACETVRAVGPNGPVVINRSTFDADQAEDGEKVYSLEDGDEVGAQVPGQAVASNRRSMTSGDHAQMQMDASLTQAGVAGDAGDDEADTLETVIDGKNLPKSVNIPAALPGTAEADELTDVDPPADGSGIARSTVPATTTRKRGGRKAKS